jgi:hypothetical protein
MPHLAHIALTSADPAKQVPIPIWMHRGCVPFISRSHFESIYWTTLEPIVQALWRQGNQVLFYAEGNWDAHLERFAELPAGSIVYHIDRGDPERVHQILGSKFCLSGGVPNALLLFGKPADVKAHCRKLIETIGSDGGYILDASAIIQSDCTVENLVALSEAASEYGVYRSPSSPSAKIPPAQYDGPGDKPAWLTAPSPRPGVCLPWEEKRKELPPVNGDPAIPERIWNDLEGLAYLYIWHVLLSF